jgi:hypothetical protein
MAVDRLLDSRSFLCWVIFAVAIGVLVIFSVIVGSVGGLGFPGAYDVFVVVLISCCVGQVATAVWFLWEMRQQAGLPEFTKEAVGLGTAVEVCAALGYLALLAQPFPV